jgi:hypothetical protein
MIRQGVSLFGRALRETGQALDRVGLRIAEKELFNETFSRHRQLMTIFNKVCNEETNNLLMLPFVSLSCLLSLETISCT